MKLVIAHRDVAILAKKVVAEVVEDNVLGLAAETAYSFFFGLFPAFLFAAPILALFGDKQRLFDALFSRIAPALPTDALDLVRGVLHDVIFATNAPAVISIGGLLALYGGAGMFSSLISALNAAYETHDTRSWWRQKAIAIAATTVAAIALGSAMTLLLGGQQLLELFVRALGLGPFGAALGAIFQYVIGFLLIVASLWGCYVTLPDVKLQKRSHALVGAVFAATAWILFTALFRLYVVNFGAYNRTYGTIGAVIVLLTWMYWTMFVVLVGGELNSELHAGTGVIAEASDGRAGSRIQSRDGIAHSSSERN